jgi:hypothetical protein
VGGATASDMLFMRTVRNRLISRDQFVLIRTLSRIVMAGIVVVVLSGLGLLFEEYFRTGTMETLGQAHFQAKAIVVFVILINGIVFHSAVFRFLTKHVGEQLDEETAGSRLWVLAGSGAASVVSWYVVVALAVLGPLPMPLLVLVGIYVVLLAGAATVAYFVLRYLFSGNIEHTFGHVKDSSKMVSVVLLGLLILLLAGALIYGFWSGDEALAQAGQPEVRMVEPRR